MPPHRVPQGTNWEFLFTPKKPPRPPLLNGTILGIKSGIKSAPLILILSLKEARGAGGASRSAARMDNRGVRGCSEANVFIFAAPLRFTFSTALGMVLAKGQWKRNGPCVLRKLGNV